MDAGTLSIKTIFGQERRHLVPLFQRPYVWTRVDQWEPLWEDIRSVVDRLMLDQAVRPHFLGAIVVDQVRKPTGHLETRLLVDGQQRFTTLQILLEAFADICFTQGVEKHYKALVKLTRNDDPLSVDVDEQFKVWPTNVDQADFRQVMLCRSPQDLLKAIGCKSTATEVGRPIPDAYLFFHAVIRDWLRPEAEGFELRVDKLYSALREHLRMVVIDLDKDDDAQLIFETLNARGTPLLPSDLIKNYLFHRIQTEGKEIDPLYQKYWKPFDDQTEYWREELGRGHARRARIDIFLTHFLTLQVRDEVPVGHLYSQFRSHANEPGAPSPSDLLDLMKKHAAVYRDLDHMDARAREGVFMDRLHLMEVTTAYPFLLDLFVRHRDEPETRSAILEDVESFLVRRMVCQLNTRGYNRLFLDLVEELRGANGTPAARVRTALLSSDAESNRWPNDEEFRQAWLHSPLYRTLVQRRIRLLLEAIERAMHTGKTEEMQFGEKLTIEHLLPQEWRPHYPLPSSVPQEKAVELRENAIHRLGNLTLLTKKLNPSVSNGPWSEKRTAILEKSILLLNKPSELPETWDEDAIQARADRILQRALKVWSYPKK